MSMSIKGENVCEEASWLKRRWVCFEQLSTSAPPPSPSSPSGLPCLSAKRIRPPGQEHNTRPGVKHSPQEFLLSALPKPCGWIISDLPSASCQQCFCLLGGGGVGQISQEKCAFHLVLLNQYGVYAYFWIRIRHPTSFFFFKAFLLHQTTKAFPLSFFGHQIFLWFST